MLAKTLISKSTLAAVLAGTALTLGSAGAMAQAADAADDAPDALQQDAAPDSAGQADSQLVTEGGFITQQASSQTLAKSILGISLRDGPGDDAQEIGKVTDLILDDNNQLQGVVVGVGGFLGMGRKDVGIPWDKIDQLDPANKTAVTNLSKEELKDAPEFVTTEEMEREEQAQRQMEENQSQAGSGGVGAPAPAPAE